MDLLARHRPPEPVFDEVGSPSIGDIALAPNNPGILYVGTGEANDR